MSRLFATVLVSSLVAPLVAAQGKPAAPPAAAWPALFSSKPATPIDAAEWREDVAESGKIVARLRSPSSWKPRRAQDVLLAVESHDSFELVSIQPTMTAPVPRPMPLSRARLQEFIAGMSRYAAGIGAQTLGIGQGQAGKRWWVWQELDVPMSQYERLAINRPGRDLSRFSGVRMWHLTTTVNAEVIIILAQRLMQSGMTTEMADEELRKSGQLFHQIISRITLESR